LGNDTEEKKKGKVGEETHPGRMKRKRERAKRRWRERSRAKSLMYPGSFILHDALEVWFKNGTKKEIREAAAKAYAKNQRISTKGARTVFSEVE
jgi:hypothetical protein